MKPARNRKTAPDVHAVRAMFASLGLPVCDDAVAIAEARDAQRDSKNRQLNSTKGSIAVAAQAWFEAVDGLLNQRTKLLEGLFTEFSALADALLVMAGAAGRKRLAGRVRAELQSLAERWMGARPDLAEAWVDRWLAERGRSLPADAAGAEAPHPERRKRLMLAMVGALAVVATLGGLYHSVGLGEAPLTAAAATHADGPAPSGELDPAALPDDVAAQAPARSGGTADASDTAPVTAEPSDSLVTAVHSPNVAFGGHRLVIAIQTPMAVDDELTDAVFEGATLYDVRRAPGGVAVELAVQKPLDGNNGLAQWSFRISDLDGQRSELITGSCKVLQGGW